MNLYINLFSALAIFFTATVYVFQLYLSVMNMKRNLNKMTGVAKVFGCPILIIGYALDIAYNIVIGTLMFAELPREFLLTDRLKRHKRGDRASWRWALANWWCVNLLNPFDPSGKHC